MRDFQVLFRESKAEYSLPRKLFLEKEELVRRVAYSRSYNYMSLGGEKWSSWGFVALGTRTRGFLLGADISGYFVER